MSITTNTGPITFYRGEDPLKANKLNEAFSERVLRLGDTMVGKLVLAMDPTDALDAVTKQYVDRNFLFSLNAAYLPLLGGTMQGFITLHALPTQPMHAVPKQYVDTAAASIGQGVYLPLAGGTLTGALFLAADPSQALQAATKHYVDITVGAVDWSTIPGKPATFPPTLPIPESGVTNLIADLAGKEPTIVGGTTAQYWRGDKTWVAFPAIPAASSTLPIIEGTAAIGVATTYARADHVHPSLAGSGLSDAPSDGKAYSRRNAVWTSNPFYDAKGNVGIGLVPPAGQAATDPSYGAWLFAWGITTGNYGDANIYWNGTSWARLAAAPVSLFSHVGGRFAWSSALTGAAGSAATLTERMSLDAIGNLTVGNAITAPGPIIGYNFTARQANGYPLITFENTAGGANTKRAQLFITPSGDAGWQFVNDAGDAVGQFFSAARNGYAVASATLTAPNIYLTGEVSASGNIFANGAVFPGASGTGNGFALYLASDASRQIRFTSDNWRLFWQNDGALVYAAPTGGPLWYVTSGGAGYFLNNVNIFNGIQYRNLSANAVGFGWDGPGNYLNAFVDGSYQGHIAWKDQDNNFARVRATNSIMNVTGIMYVADNGTYYMGRDSNTGTWNFVEANTNNFSIGTDGYVRPRVGVITTNLYAYSNVYFGNSWNSYIGLGGSGQVMAFLPGYYWDFSNGYGTMIYVMNSVNQWVIHYNSSCYNARNWTGGVGPYVDVSDDRTKREVSPAMAGLREVLKLEPIRFRRIRNDPDVEDREEVGFSAQAVRKIIPEAVWKFGLALPDGTGGWESDEPTLGLATTPIVAALVNAVKELTARIADLEERA